MSMKGTTAAGPGVIRPWRPLGAAARTLRDRRLTVVRPWTSNRDASAQGFRVLTDVPESPMVWLQRAPVVLLRTVDARHSWHLSPFVNVYLATSQGSIAAIAAASLPSPLAAPSATHLAGAASLMERRIETAFTRHTRSLLETLVTRRERVSSIEPGSCCLLVIAGGYAASGARSSRHPAVVVTSDGRRAAPASAGPRGRNPPGPRA